MSMPLGMLVAEHGEAHEQRMGTVKGHRVLS